METLTETIETTHSWNRQRSSEELRDYVLSRLTSLSEDDELFELELAA